jgi:hypothetical protein
MEMAVGWKLGPALRRFERGLLGVVIRNVQWVITFHWIVLSLIFFRSPTFAGAWSIVGHIAHTKLADFRALPFTTDPAFLINLLLPCALLAVEVWVERKGRPVEDMVQHRGTAVRWMVYAGLLAALLLLGHFGPMQFIYFQF